MAGINRVILVGNLGKDPEVKSLESGVKLAKFSLATTETFKDKDGNRTEHTEWHNIVFWRGLADVAEKYLRKGSTIYLEGRIRTRTWKDEDGKNRYMTEIQGDNMTMLGGRRDNNSQQADNATKAAEPKPEPIAESDTKQTNDLPF